MDESRIKEIINCIKKTGDISDEDLRCILTEEPHPLLHAAADEVRRSVYGRKVFIRGLIEFTNICRNDCYYCGIRKGNTELERYRLTEDEIMECCRDGYELGFRTFVLQGGEDPYFSDERLCAIVSHIKKDYPDCAVTLSVGERSRESYKALFDAGADRYLLRHETADSEHYGKLHPGCMSLENRKRCLYDLKEIGYVTGSGFMVGSPYQTTETLISDIRFLQELKPHMIGIGPYITHSATPFADFKSGSLELTLNILALLRLLFPKALLPATTALGTIAPDGRELGLKAGANVVMPNLSPTEHRTQYELYDKKICTGEESAQCRACLENRVRSAGYEIVSDRGDPAI